MQFHAVYGEHVANELSKRIGYIRQESVTKSLTIHGILANRSKSMSDQRRALLLPQELMQFPDTDLLLLRAGITPIHGDKVRYYADGLSKAVSRRRRWSTRSPR